MANTLVVGGTGGIGIAMVRRYAAAGDDVVFTYLRSEESALALARSDDVAGTIRAEQLDIRDLSRLEEIVDKVADDLRCVVLAAASHAPRQLLRARARHWQWTYDVNVRPVVPLLQRSIGPLAATGGSFLALSSLGSRMTPPYYGLLGSAKAAVESLVRYAAVEAGPLGVRVNALCPGPVDTPALRKFPDAGRGLAEAARRTPFGRLVTCEEVAETAYWLTSDAASMITGQVIVIDGGFEVVGPTQE